MRNRKAKKLLEYQLCDLRDLDSDIPQEVETLPVPEPICICAEKTDAWESGSLEEYWDCPKHGRQSGFMCSGTRSLIIAFSRYGRCT